MIVFKAQKKSIGSLAFSPDGQYLVTGGHDSFWRLYALAPGGTPKLLHEDTRSSDGCRSLTFSPDSRWILGLGARWIAGRADAAWLVDVRDPVFPRHELEQPGAISSIGFCGQSLVFGFGAEMTRWSIDLANGTTKKLPCGWGDTRTKESFPTGPLVPTTDGRLVAAGFGELGKVGYDSIVHLYDSNTGELRGKLRRPFSSAHPTAACFSTDGSRFAANYGPSIAVFDVATQKEIASWSTGRKHITDLTFTVDGTRLLAVSNDGSARQWETKGWNEVRALDWEIGKLTRVVASADGCLLAGGSHNGKVVIWDAV